MADKHVCEGSRRAAKTASCGRRSRAPARQPTAVGQRLWRRLDGWWSSSAAVSRQMSVVGAARKVTHGRSSFFFGVEHVRGGADQERMTRLFAAFQRPPRSTRMSAMFWTSRSSFGPLRTFTRIGRVEQQAVRELRLPAGRRLPLLPFDVVNAAEPVQERSVGTTSLTPLPERAGAKAMTFSGPVWHRYRSFSLPRKTPAGRSDPAWSISWLMAHREEP